MDKNPPTDSLPRGLSFLVLGILVMLALSGVWLFWGFNKMSHGIHGSLTGLVIARQARQLALVMDTFYVTETPAQKRKGFSLQALEAPDLLQTALSPQNLGPLNKLPSSIKITATPAIVSVGSTKYAAGELVYADLDRTDCSTMVKALSEGHAFAWIQVNEGLSTPWERQSTGVDGSCEQGGNRVVLLHLTPIPVTW